MSNTNELHPIIKEDIKNILSEPLPWINLHNKTVLITGATGLIPSYIVHTLMNIDNVQVIALSRSEEKLRKKFASYANNDRFTYVACDISKPVDLKKLLSRKKLPVDIIFHGAGNTDVVGIEDIVNTINVNIQGTRNCLEFLRMQGSGAFIPFSSATIYGLCQKDQLFETDYGYVDLQGRDAPYVQSIRTSEVYCYAYNRQFNVDVFIPRISWTIGVEMNRNNGMRSDFLYDIIDRKDIIIKSDGKRILPFCYISDICAALFYIYFFGKVAEPYNIVASDGNLSVEQFANLHTKILNVSSKVIIKNDFNDGKPNIIINSDKLSSIGWQSRTTIENGIQKIYNYMVSQNKQCI